MSGGTQGGERGAAPSFFYEDEVFRVSKNGEVEFGMVTENWDMYSSDEDDEDEDDKLDNFEKVPHGCVAVTWLPKSKDEVIAEGKVQLSDRSLMPGDVVRRLIAGKDTQRGYCRSVKVIADVQVLGSKNVILGVPATNLIPVQKLQSEIAVYMDSWIGVIREAKYNIGLKYHDGSSCVASSDHLMDHFEELRSNNEFHTSDIFYPGQKLRGKLRMLIRIADSMNFVTDELKKSKEKKVVTVVVTDVVPQSVKIQWQWQTPELPSLESALALRPPPDKLSGDDLKRLKCLNLFESCTVQLCDMSYYTPNTSDVILERGEWKKQVLSRLNNSSNKGETTTSSGSTAEDPLNLNADDGNNNNNRNAVAKDAGAGKVVKKLMAKVSTRSLKKKKLKKSTKQTLAAKIRTETPVVVETLHTQSFVDVVWQDGTYEEGMKSSELYPIHHLDDHEFFPGDFVVAADVNDFKKYGVIQSMDHCGRVAVVKWFEAYSFQSEQVPKPLEELEMSVYDIKDHPDFRFRPGTIVIRVANLQPEQCPSGQILDNYPDGQVRVWWGNGVITSCWPQDLFRLGEYDDSDGEIWDDEDGRRNSLNDDEEDDEEDDDEDDAKSDASWETTDEEQSELVIPLPFPEDETTSQHTREAEECRYNHIRRLIERIQNSLVITRESIVASSNVSVSEEASQGVVGVPNLMNFDERGLTKKLLYIYKDCQYLDKIMGTSFFATDDLTKWSKDKENSSSRSNRITEHISRLFDSPKQGDSNTQLPTTTAASSSNSNISTTVVEDGLNPGTVIYEVCSLILKKLVEAHDEYEKRYGGASNSSKQLINGDLDSSKEEESEIALENDEAKVVDKIESSLELPSSTSEEVEKSSKFSVLDKVPDSHRYRMTSYAPMNPRSFLKTVQKELSLLRESLPDGILVKGFEDRMDLYSVLIEGPEKTPYEDGLFMFDIALPPAYPSVPPLVHYIAFCTDRLNPNLYEEGKVCVSLLGTWNGRGTEVWTSSSSLLQLLVSIQGLILGPEPYYNEAGYEKQKGTQQGAENSRMYNENVLIKLVQSMTRVIVNPPAAWETETTAYINAHGPRMVERYNSWLEINIETAKDEAKELPPFPLLPVSKGFLMTMKKAVTSFSKLLNNFSTSSSSNSTQ